MSNTLSIARVVRAAVMVFLAVGIAVVARSSLDGLSRVSPRGVKTSVAQAVSERQRLMRNIMNDLPLDR